MNPRSLLLVREGSRHGIPPLKWMVSATCIIEGDLFPSEITDGRGERDAGKIRAGAAVFTQFRERIFPSKGGA